MKVIPIGPEAVDAVAALDLEVFSESERTALGMRYARQFVRWFARHENAIALQVCEGGRPVGYVVGADTGATGAIYRRLAPTAALSALARPSILLNRRVLQMARTRVIDAVGVLDDSADATGDGLTAAVFRLHTIAVAPARRRSGLGKLLLARFCEVARSRRVGSIILEVRNDNEAAQAFYLAQGWRGGTAGTARTPYRLALTAD